MDIIFLGSGSSIGSPYLFDLMIDNGAVHKTKSRSLDIARLEIFFQESFIC